ncbi:MAG TPA: arginine N-succinyltransferase [Polyangiales bacterium]|nr:arginine N-succinyltransferase [Polyangiales bacterium]
MTFVIRPAERADLERIEALVAQVRAGLTSLTVDRETLRQKIASSSESFVKDTRQPANEEYFFVLADDGLGEIAGMCALKAAVGLQDAFYSYRIGTVVHASKELNVHRVHPALYLSNDYTGCTELTSLFLGPAHRGKGLGTLLSKSRLLFMAEAPYRFAEKVIAEIRGISDDGGRSPFWDGLGQHFFSMDFPTADHLVGSGHKSFIAELMPKHPIYVVFLPQEAQEAIGKPHPNSRRAMELLEDEGFHYENYVDIFDGGPTVECRRDEIRAVRASKRRSVQIGSVEPENATACLLANTRVQDFRCCVAHVVQREPDQIVLSEETAGAMRIRPGEQVRMLES